MSSELFTLTDHLNLGLNAIRKYIFFVVRTAEVGLLKWDVQLVNISPASLLVLFPIEVSQPQGLQHNDRLYHQMHTNLPTKY